MGNTTIQDKVTVQGLLRNKRKHFPVGKNILNKDPSLY